MALEVLAAVFIFAWVVVIVSIIHIKRKFNTCLDKIIPVGDDDDIV